VAPWPQEAPTASGVTCRKVAPWPQEADREDKKMFTEFRYASRSVLRSPGFAFVAVLTLALGIGANTAIFSVVRGVLLRPLPFADPDRLVQVWSATASEARGSQSARSFLVMQRNNRSLVAAAGYRQTMMSASVKPDDVQQLAASFVTIDFFDVLGIQPLHGRTFSRRTDASASERVAVIGREAWRQLFADDPNAIGQRVRLNGEPHTVVGVLPSRAGWPERTGLWVLSPRAVPPSPVPLPDDQLETDDEMGYISVIARLKREMPLPQAQDDLTRLVREMRRGSPGEQTDIRLGRMYDEIVGNVRPALLVLQAAVGLVLVIACANISSLLLARASGRRRELAIRAALGAGRGRLVRHTLAESVALGVAGALAGLLLGAWLVALLTRVLPPNIPRREEIALDWTVALVALAIALLCSALFGAIPALQASRTDALATMKESGSRTMSSRSRGRATLVVAEIALTLVLLVGAGLLINSFVRLQRVDSGFRPDHTTVMGIALPEARYPTAKQQTALFDELLTRLAGRPEFQTVAIGFPAPLRGNNASGSFRIEGRPADGDRRPFANFAIVSGGYFSAMGIPVVSGRTFIDPGGSAERVVMVNQALARRYFDGTDPLGKLIRFEGERAVPMTIVGVVGDARQLGLHAPAPPILYFQYDDFTLPFTNVVVRSPLPESSVAAAMRTELLQLEPQLSIGEASALRTILDRSIAEPRSRSFLLTTFALLALVLAAVGIYGLISHSVTERTREIGIRMALGAPRRQVLGSVLREGFNLAALGIILGLIGAVVASRAISRFLFGVGATDPATFAIVCTLLLGVALLASYIPSRRAVRVDPVVALRSE
jgi:putative ABC transport system permease protein